jgi:GntR family L-lactate dehydrogenase operon transcriptional regulator
MPKRLADDVARRVRALIEEQQLEAGMRLPAERQLAAQLGVSRNSLREALAMLVNEGVLLSRRGGGTFVRWQHEAWSEQNIVQPLKTLLADDPTTASISSKPATPSKPAPPGMRRCGPPTPKKKNSPVL